MFTIYQILNKINWKSYIGFTTKYDLNKRIAEHVADAKRNSFRPICNAIRKYGIDNFETKILEIGENGVYGLKIAEPTYIEWLKPEYNICAGGEGTLGRVCSEESKKKSSMTQKGRKLSEEHKKALCTPKVNKRTSLNWNAGLTKETDSRVREASNLLMGRPSWNKGKLGYFTKKLGFTHRNVICPHCRLSGGDNAMKRYHFINCKKKVTENVD